LPSGREPEGPQFKPRPYPFPLKTPGRGHFILSRLNVGGWPALPAAAATVGLAVRADRPGEVVWELRGFDLRTRGHVSRDYGTDGLGKTVRTWRTDPGPVLGYFGLGARFRDLWIVEDALSAARLCLDGHNALCLFGTHLSREGEEELRDYVARVRATSGLGARILIALDRDASGAGAAMARRLTSRLGCETIPVFLHSDLKDMPEDEFDPFVDRWSPDATTKTLGRRA